MIRKEGLVVLEYPYAVAPATRYRYTGLGRAADNW